MPAPAKTFLSNLFAGDLTPFGGPAVGDDLAGSLRAEQMALVKRNSPGMMLAIVCNSIVLMVGLMLADSPHMIAAMLWGGVMICLASFYGLKSYMLRGQPQPRTVSRRALQRLCISSVLLGSLWGVVPGFFFADAAAGSQLLMACMISGMLAGAALAFATLPIACIAFIAPILLGCAVCLWRVGDVTFLLVGVLIAIYTSILLHNVFSYGFEFTRRLIQRMTAESAVRHDPLTSLPNRMAFNEGLNRALKRLDLTGNEFAILLLDLDNLKLVNDKHGHPGGDDYLNQVTARLRRSTRERDLIARIGGGEFAVIASDLDSADAAFAIAQQIHDLFKEPFLIDGQPFSGTASIGIALAPRDGDSPNDLMKHLDIALSRAKKAGPGTIRFFEPGDDKAARDKCELLRDLEGAVARNELHLVYQPLLKLADDRIVGFEALLRWSHPQRGLIPPNQFIGLAEESGLIHGIGDWVIRQACADLACWPSDIRIAVNFSVAQLENPRVLPGVISALAESGIAPARLEIEITESMLISKYATAAATLDSLLALGVTVALDDFGTGFSSLTYLRKLPFSRIKIDQSFVADMLVQPDSAAIVKSVLSLASDMGIGVVAEGIETEEQLAFFRGTTCEEAQGYFIGRPMVADRVSALLTMRAQADVGMAAKPNVRAA